MNNRFIFKWDILCFECGYQIPHNAYVEMVSMLPHNMILIRYNNADYPAYKYSIVEADMSNEKLRELQLRAIKGIKIITQLCELAQTLPASDALNEVIKKHDTALQRYGDICNQIEEIDKTVCYYGIVGGDVGKCPGHTCTNCDWKRLALRWGEEINVQ